MRYILCYIFILISFLAKSQYTCSNSFMQDDFGGYQFYNEIVEILKKAKNKNIKKIEFNLKEMRYKDDSIEAQNFENTTFLCNWTTDSTLTVIKHYSHKNRCFLWGYNFLIKKGIFIMTNTIPVPKKYIKKFDCDDSNSKYENTIKTDYSIFNEKELTILKVKKGKRRWGVQYPDSIKYTTIYQDTVTYHLNENERCVKRTGWGSDLEVNYKGNDTVIYQYSQDDGLITWYTVSKIKEVISTYAYMLYKSNLQTFNETDSNERDHSSTMRYTLNKKYLPEKIEIMDAKFSSDKIEGSIMNIKY